MQIPPSECWDLQGSSFIMSQNMKTSGPLFPIVIVL